MIKPEQRLKDFKSGMKKLSNESRDKIHKLINILLLAEQMTISMKKEKPPIGVVDIAGGH